MAKTELKVFVVLRPSGARPVDTNQFALKKFQAKKSRVRQANQAQLTTVKSAVDKMAAFKGGTTKIAVNKAAFLKLTANAN